MHEQPPLQSARPSGYFPQTGIHYGKARFCRDLPVPDCLQQCLLSFAVHAPLFPLLLAPSPPTHVRPHGPGRSSPGEERTLVTPVADIKASQEDRWTSLKASLTICPSLATPRAGCVVSYPNQIAQDRNWDRDATVGLSNFAMVCLIFPKYGWE